MLNGAFAFKSDGIYRLKWIRDSVLEDEIKSLAQQKRFSDKVGDKIGDIVKIACPTEKIF